MPHESEKSFGTHIEEWLLDQYGADAVEREHYFPDSGRYADFLVEGRLATWAIEVENDAESILHGVGQALIYAAHDPAYRPAVIVPVGHIEEPERSFLEPYVRILEFSTEEPVGPVAVHD